MSDKLKTIAEYLDIDLKTLAYTEQTNPMWLAAEFKIDIEWSHKDAMCWSPMLLDKVGEGRFRPFTQDFDGDSITDKIQACRKAIIECAYAVALLEDSQDE